MKTKADFESTASSDDQVSRDLHEAGRLFSQWQASQSTAEHIDSSVELECAMGCYSAAIAQRRAGSPEATNTKKQGDKYLAEARKKLNAGM